MQFPLKNIHGYSFVFMNLCVLHYGFPDGNQMLVLRHQEELNFGMNYLALTVLCGEQPNQNPKPWSLKLILQLLAFANCLWLGTVSE